MAAGGTRQTLSRLSTGRRHLSPRPRGCRLPPMPSHARRHPGDVHGPHLCVHVLHTAGNHRRCRSPPGMSRLGRPVPLPHDLVGLPSRGPTARRLGGVHRAALLRVLRGDGARQRARRALRADRRLRGQRRRDLPQHRRRVSPRPGRSRHLPVRDPLHPPRTRTGRLDRVELASRPRRRRPSMNDVRLSTRNITRTFRAASAADLDAGLGWYVAAHRIATTLDPASPARAAAVIAVLSPLLPWPRNVTEARNAYIGHPIRTLGASRRKARQILAGADPELVVSGPKVRAFWRTIADPTEPRAVVIDRHAIDIAAGRVLG